MATYPGVAVVIGAGSGIGRATACLYVSRGCSKVAIGDVNAEGLAETKRQMLAINSQAQITNEPCDVTSEDSINSFIAKAVETFGRLDYACNVAGIVIAGSSPDFTAAEWDKIFSVNTRGMWLCQKAEVTQMLKQEPLKTADMAFPARGSIANVASMAGLRAYDNLPSYCATKHAIIGFTKADAMRYGADHIRINAVCPGVIATPLLGIIDPNDTTNIDAMTKDMAVGRQGRPEEVAEAMLWLTSPLSSLVTAIALPVNGGMVGA